MFGWLGRAVVRRPWFTIAAWLVAATAIVALAPNLNTQSDQKEFLPSKYESVQAGKLAAKAFPEKKDQDPASIVVKRTDGKPLAPTDETKVGQVAKALQDRHIPAVKAVVTGPELVAPNKKVQLINVPFPVSWNDKKLTDQNTAAVKELRKAAAQEFKGTGLQYGVTGTLAMGIDNQESSEQAQQIITIGAIVLIIILILVIFRSPIAALLPILVVASVLTVSNKLTAVIGNIFDLKFDANFQLLIAVVLYGIGTDYILFVLFRFRERLRAGDDKRTAMATAVQRVGEAIASAASVVIVAFLALLLATFKAFGSLGPQLAISVGVMLITALTLVPALSALLGRFVFWPSKSWKKQPKGLVWARLGNFVGRRPAVVALGSGALLVGLAAGALSFKADYDFAGQFPQNTQSAKAMKDLQQGFPAGTLTPTVVYLNGDKPLEQQQIADFRHRLAGAPGVGKVSEQSEVSKKDGRTAEIDLLLKDNPNSNKAISLVKDKLRDAVHKAAPPGTKALVGGQTAVWADINAANNRDLSVILPVAMALIALILALMLRAVVAPIYLAVVVLLNFAATLGAGVLVFQNLQGKPGLIFMMPILLYLFVLAVGTDYNILMIARLREEAREGHEPRQAATLGIQHAGPSVAAAGVILAGTFGAMLLSPISMMQQIGLGVAIGIVLAAFVMSMFLVPALTALVGHTAWWPGHGDAPRGTGAAPDQEQLPQYADEVR